MSTEQVVIVGGGLGGLRTVESLRRKGFDGRIVLIGAEQESPYDRPPLSKSFLEGDAPPSWLRDDVDSLGMQFRTGRRAVELDPVHSRIGLDDGSTVDYDHLVIATGSEPVLPAGWRRPDRVQALRTLDDARALRSALCGVDRLTIVGAGFIGCEVAATARRMGLEVTLLESAPGPLWHAVGAEVSARVTQLHESHGVELRCGALVEDLEQSDRKVRLTVAGEALDADHVLIALGARPQLDWLSRAGLVVDAGVVCDPGGRTSLAQVYAVGDVAQWDHPLLDAPRRVEHWTSTADQADVVASNILGIERQLTTAPYFWSDQYETKIQAMGFLTGTSTVDLVDTASGCVALYSNDTRLTGVVGLSAPRHVMRIGRLVTAGSSRDDAWKLAEQIA
jgi:3-phenylpropionate/trans-cinnamate dioxygenase ferredoxin reductase subunit